MQTQPFRQVVVLILDTETNEYQFDGTTEQLNLLSFNYNPSFDPWDNMALGRFIYQKQKQLSIDTDLKFVQMLQDDEFKDLLQIINGSQVVLTEENRKYYFVQTNKLRLQQSVNINVADLEKNLEMFDSKDRQIVETYLIKKVQDAIPKKVYCVLEDSTNSNSSLRNISQALFQGFYQESNEIWKYYQVHKGEFPSREEVEQIEAYTMTGSSSTAYIKEPWYDQYSEFLKRMMAQNKQFIAHCFGHQVVQFLIKKIIAQFFGGATSKLQNIPDEYYNHYGQQKVRFIDSDTEISVFVHHGDNVTVLPTNTRLLMTSDYCPVQAYVSDNIMGLQFHPEFNIPLIKYIIKQSKHTTNADQLIQQFDSSQTAYNYDCIMLREYLITYLKTGRQLPQEEIQKISSMIL